MTRVTHCQLQKMISMISNQNTGVKVTNKATEPFPTKSSVYNKSLKPLV